MDKTLTEKRRKARRRKKPVYDSISYTTGSIDANINRFNTAMGTNIEAPTCVASGGLTEAKRYVRRYYIRPQNIFCSNKAEILKALIELDDANCSVYTLNNLGDEKDVSRLMSSDIIYYYDNGILYDKNKVKVMDYDLSIKKEENRKHFANVDKASEREFKNAYEDRMTDATELEEDMKMMKLPYSAADLATAIELASEEVFLGYNFQDNDEIRIIDGEVYADTEWYAGKTNDGKYYLIGWMVGDDGAGPEEGDYDEFDTIEELYEAITYLEELEDMPKDIVGQANTSNPFDLSFEDVDVFGNHLHESRSKLCCICGEPYGKYGNNPEPYMSADEGRCCDACNLKFVLPARIEAFRAEGY